MSIMINNNEVPLTFICIGNWTHWLGRGNVNLVNVDLVIMELASLLLLEHLTVKNIIHLCGMTFLLVQSTTATEWFVLNSFIALFYSIFHTDSSIPCYKTKILLLS